MLSKEVKYSFVFTTKEKLEQVTQYLKAKIEFWYYISIRKEE